MRSRDVPQKARHTFQKIPAEKLEPDAKQNTYKPDFLFLKCSLEHIP